MNVPALALQASSSSNFLKRNSLLIALLARFSSPALALPWSVSTVGTADSLPTNWDYMNGNGINDLGQVTGGTFDFKKPEVAFVLSAVPEPETYAMMLAGLSMLGFMRRRKSAALRQLQ